ncbi:MAG: hypothetical protein ACK4UJ_02395 [Leptonema sp. (in: bacteria)]
MQKISKSLENAISLTFHCKCPASKKEFLDSSYYQKTFRKKMQNREKISKGLRETKNLRN